MSASDHRPERGAWLRGPLHEVRGLLVVDAPVEVLAGRTATKLRARVGQARYLAYVFRLPGMAAVVVPPEVCAAAGVGAGDPIELWLDAVRPERPGSVPADVAVELAKGRADLLVLSRQERRQSLLLIKEAGTPEVRRARIEALVTACQRRASARRRGPGPVLPSRAAL